MARKNVAPKKLKTHEGATAKHINAEQALNRAVMACLLWENQFYENGVTIADRITELVPRVDPFKVAQIANKARNKMYLRHAPLLIARAMARLDSHKSEVSATLASIVQRPDELAEFLTLYWGGGNRQASKDKALSGQVKKGLATAFSRFDAYQLAKYNRGDAVKLRDVMRLTHPKPKDPEQGHIWKGLIEGTLAPPDTWEVAFSRIDGEEKDKPAKKKAIWERLLTERKLGGMALLRNLRNMKLVGVEDALVKQALLDMRPNRILPFRYIAAAKHAPQWEDVIEKAMLKSLGNQAKLPGKTILLMDVSGSMDGPLSGRSELMRLDAGYGLGILLREICEDIEIYTFSSDVKLIPARHGFALAEAMHNSQAHMSTYLGRAVQVAIKSGYDRLIAVTDEQSHDTVTDPKKGKNYVINVASYRNGVGYGPWTHIDGWSEAVIDYIRAVEDVV